MHITAKHYTRRCEWRRCDHIILRVLSTSLVMLGMYLLANLLNFVAISIS